MVKNKGSYSNTVEGILAQDSAMLVRRLDSNYIAFHVETLNKMGVQYAERNGVPDPVVRIPVAGGKYILAWIVLTDEETQTMTISRLSEYGAPSEDDYKDFTSEA